MSGRKAARRRPSAASSRRKVVERRPRYSTERTGRSRHSTPVPRVLSRDQWSWLAPPAHALQLTGWAALPLRAFLGFTFCFAGLQKLANPGFFDATNPVSIQSQLAGAARRRARRWAPRKARRSSWERSPAHPERGHARRRSPGRGRPPDPAPWPRRARRGRRATRPRRRRAARRRAAASRARAGRGPRG